MDYLDNQYKTYSYIDKKNLITRLNKIKNKKCYMRIFKLIHQNDTNYSQNENGVFFNITNMSNDLLIKIDNILNYYEKKKEDNDIDNSSSDFLERNTIITMNNNTSLQLS